MTTYLTHTFSNRELKTFSYPNQTKESVFGTRYEDTLCLEVYKSYYVKAEDGEKRGDSASERRPFLLPGVFNPRKREEVTGISLDSSLRAFRG